MARPASDLPRRIALSAARERGDVLVLPASAYAECLVSPARRGPDAVTIADRFIDAVPAHVEPGSRAIAAAAAGLRAAHGRALRLPDALVVATAQVVSTNWASRSFSAPPNSTRQRPGPKIPTAA